MPSVAFTLHLAMTLTGVIEADPGAASSFPVCIKQWPTQKVELTSDTGQVVVGQSLQNVHRIVPSFAL